MIKIETFTFNPFQENTFVVYDETGEAVVIDPGCYEAHEKKELAQFIESSKLTVKLLLNTHCHIDHVLGNHFIKSKYQVPFLIHEKELPVLQAVKSYASNYGFPLYSETLPDLFLKEHQPVLFGNTTMLTMLLPGHAPGHIGFYHSQSNSLLSGDVLFESSIGRTDLPGGDYNTLIKSIQEKVFALPDETIVYAGHGNTTTVGEEKLTNPFCAIPVTR
ncbi:MAG: MBL fold metallo-hydrolase [Cyclobacteriaceae bacterium]|nr:MBL fold metallo-hydrolase [Cyclobacteriaceae bacterium]